MYSKKSERVYIIDAKRTAIGAFLGSLYEADPSDVCAQLIKKGFNNKFIKDIESVIVGNVISAGTGQGIARKIAIKAGIPENVPAYSLNMVCGSGMQAIRNAVKEILCGANLVLAGGFEFMSNIPFATDTYMRLGKKFGDFKMVDLMTHDGLIDSFSGVHMGITAENIAHKYNITREEQDEYSYATLQKAIEAVDTGKFDEEIVPVTITDYKGREFSFDKDEFPNRKSTPEKVSSLKPTFLKDGTGTVTAASSSGINDGASFVLIASESYCKENNVIPIAEIMGDTAIGLDPQLMGLGPFYAIDDLLDKTNMDITDIDYFEINEAFAAQVLGSYKLLSEKHSISLKDLMNKCNVYGSGIGLGHPLGASGARIVTTLTHVLKNNNGKYGIARLRDEYGKQSDLDIIAESWELSTHPAGNSIIASGTHKGMPFGEYIEKYGEEVVGWKCKAFSKFPILIKLIDSRQALSVQVHPDDDFAMAYENEYGKNEMWYIVDCDEDAFIYCGFNKNLAEAEISERLRHNTIEEVLNKIPVHKGEAYFIPAGTVHAIGKGILICEIQQNSNCTYRLYDYNRRDKNGNLRELHIDKALQVLNMDKYEPYNSNNDEIADENENVKKELCACKYFEVTAVKVKEKYDFTVDLSSFAAIVAVNGNGTIETGTQSITFKRGDTMFLSVAIFITCSMFTSASSAISATVSRPFFNSLITKLVVFAAAFSFAYFSTSAHILSIPF